MRLCRREDEDHALRRLLKGLEERVERLCRQHVHFVDDVDFIAPCCRCKLHRLAQIADLIDAAVRCRIDLEHIHR